MESLAQVRTSIVMIVIFFSLAVSGDSAMDECTLGTDNCDTNALCIDTEASFICTCNQGYEGDGVTCTSEYRNEVIAELELCVPRYR